MKEIVFRKKEIQESIIYMLFLLPLLGSGIPAYIYALVFLFWNIRCIKFKYHDVLFLIILVGWCFFKSHQSDTYASLVLLRYYFGFYIFYLFFNNYNLKLDLEKLLFIICITVLTETLLVNTVVKPEWLLNYPKEDMGVLKFETKILGFYQRPYSIGNNSTITSSLIMILIFQLYLSSKSIVNSYSKKVFYLAIVTVVACGSGTGYALLIIFFIFKIGPFRSLLNSMISICFVILVYYLIFIVDIGSFNGLEKISAFYIEFLYDFKAMQVEDAYKQLVENPLQLYIGKKFESASELIIWSDFAWCDLFFCTGYVGFIFTWIILLFKVSRYNYVPILIFIIGSIHYAAAYSLPGQLLLGYIMSTNFKKYIKRRRPLASTNEGNKVLAC